jgi:predicted Fe-Mo cluster-binding NifX family protein
MSPSSSHRPPDSTARAQVRAVTPVNRPPAPPLRRAKIAFSVDALSVNAEMGAHFGRCAGFIIADVESGKLRVVANPAAGCPECAGLSAAELAVAHEVHAVISGAFGRIAPQALAEAGIATFRLASGSVREFVDGLRRPPGT